MRESRIHLPWRLGATSYVIEDGLVGNAAYLADRVAGMQLVLFDLPSGPSNLPDEAEIATLAHIGRSRGFDYVVHLLSDIAPVDGLHEWQKPLDQAQDLIARTLPLDPTYIVHLNGRALRNHEMSPDAWLRGILRSLEQVTTWVEDRSRLAVENLEGYAPDFVVAAVSQGGVGRCVDVGHLWLDGIDPIPWLMQAGDALQVVHLHGVGERDHMALTHTSPAQVDAVVQQLLRQEFEGMLVLEVFGNEDFEASMGALEASVARVLQQPCSTTM
jgi:sugar phosphate isomerase/epimerase